MTHKKRIKIAYVIDALNIGGTEKQLLKQIELLGNRGFDQSIICLHPSQFLDGLKLTCAIHVVNVKSLLSFNGIKKLLWLAGYFKKEKIDIVQTYFIDANIFGVLAAKLAGVNRIVSCRRDMGFWYTPNIIKLLRVVNYFTDRILTNSKAIYENVCKYEQVDPCKIDVIYNGIDLAPFFTPPDPANLKKDLKIPTCDTIVGIVANLNRRVKRVDVFVQAAALVLETEPDVSFVIVGSGHLSESLEEMAVDLGIQDKVKFVGLKDNIYPYLAMFDLGILTSESEGFSNAILEYMAAGLPIICPDSGGNRELVENGRNGFLVRVANHQEMAGRILDLIQNKELGMRMKTANQKKIIYYSWPRINRIIENYYINLISNGN